MNTTEKLTKEDFELGLKQFTGTNQYWNHDVPGACKLRLTDGCHFVRQEAKARWLFDLMAHLQFHKHVGQTFSQHWTLKKVDPNWVLECRNAKGEILSSRKIESTDFPLEQIDIWLYGGVCLLPSEY